MEELFFCDFHLANKTTSSKIILEKAHMCSHLGMERGEEIKFLNLNINRLIFFVYVSSIKINLIN